MGEAERQSEKTNIRLIDDHLVLPEALLVMVVAHVQVLTSLGQGHHHGLLNLRMA